MKHNNFIENKKRIEFKVGKFELNYFVMLLLFVALVVLMATIHAAQIYRSDNLQQELRLTQSMMPVQASDLKGIEWSSVLKKYTSNLPTFVRLKQILVQSQNGDKMTLVLLGAHVWDATRARQSLVSLNICNKVNLGKIERVEDKVHFELECWVS